MKRWLALGLLLWTSPSWSQNAVTQNGTVVEGDVMQWARDRVAQDPGGLQGRPATGLGLNPFAITDKNGIGLCTHTASTLGAHKSLCLGHDSNGNAIISIDGVPLPVPGSVTGTPAVADNNSLKLLPSTNSSAVLRLDFAPGNGAPAQLYKLSSAPCSLNAGAGDNGSQVPTSDGKCWIASVGAPMDLRQWGAKADNATDNGPFFQAAYNANVGCIHVAGVSGGMYKINTGATFGGTHAACFIGDPPNERSGDPTVPPDGTWISIDSTSVVPFTLSGFFMAESLFKYFAFFQVQPTPAPGWLPAPYQYIFNNTTSGPAAFEDLYFYNTTHCIYTEGGRFRFNRIRSQALGTCLSFDRNLDKLWLDELDNYTFWSTNSAVTTYTRNNVDPYVFRRTDGAYIGRIFSILTHSTLRLDTGIAAGGPPDVRVTQLTADNNLFPIYITASNSNLWVGLADIQGEAGGVHPSNSIGVNVSGSGSTVFIDTLRCRGMGLSCVDINNPLGNNSAISVGNARAENYNQDNVAGTAAWIIAGPGAIQFANAPTYNGSNAAGLLPNATAPMFYEGIGAVYATPEFRRVWTPVLAGSTTAGTATYVTPPLGWFRMNGSQVEAFFSINYNSFAGAAGNTMITGLPYTGSNFGLPNSPGFCTIGFVNIPGTLDAGATLVSAHVENNGSRIFIDQMGGSPPTTQFLPTTKMGGAGQLAGTCTYRLF